MVWVGVSNDSDHNAVRAFANVFRYLLSAQKAPRLGPFRIHVRCSSSHTESILDVGRRSESSWPYRICRLQLSCGASVVVHRWLPLRIREKDLRLEQTENGRPQRSLTVIGTMCRLMGGGNEACGMSRTRFGERSGIATLCLHSQRQRGRTLLRQPSRGENICDDSSELLQITVATGDMNTS